MERNINAMADIMKDERYASFIALFNRDRDYFECHEVMEELWLEEGRSSLLQGLLQAAVGLHHWDNDNRSGAVKLMEAALAKLSRYGDAVLGLDLERLRGDLERSLTELGARPEDAPFRAFELVVLDAAVAQAAEAWQQRHAEPGAE